MTSGLDVERLVPGADGRLIKDLAIHLHQWHLSCGCLLNEPVWLELHVDINHIKPVSH